MNDDLTAVAARTASPAGQPTAGPVVAGARVAAQGELDDRTAVDVGTIVRGRFELESMIGAGGMGVVYRAVDRLHKEMQDCDPYVAIKILNANLKRHPSALIALQRETRKAQLLAHENIINVHSFDRDGSIVYMTMELLDGKSLRSLVAENASAGLPRADAVPMIRAMAKALAYAHDNDIVHSDFKPANVFLTRKKQIKVLDFGLARAAPSTLPAAEGGSLLDSPALGGMTPAYASPEILDGAEPTPADDVFALAIVAYELLTGRHPFDYERPAKQRLADVRAIPLPGLSRSQRKALQRPFDPERTSRPENAGEFLREFDGPSKAKRAALGAGVAAVAVPIVALWLSGPKLGPATAFEDLTPEVRAQFDHNMTEGQTAMSFGDAGLNDALVYFSSAYDLHPRNPRAIRGLEDVADRFLASLPVADDTARKEVFGLLYCNTYLSGYAAVAAACDSALGAAQCAAVAARCNAAPPEVR